MKALELTEVLTVSTRYVEPLVMDEQHANEVGNCTVSYIYKLVLHCSTLLQFGLINQCSEIISRLVVSTKLDIQQAQRAYVFSSPPGV